MDDQEYKKLIQAQYILWLYDIMDKDSERKWKPLPFDSLEEAEKHLAEHGGSYFITGGQVKHGVLFVNCRFLDTNAKK